MIAPADWLVVVNTVSLADSSLGKRYRALQLVHHPSYDDFNNDYDVGLLRTITDIVMRGKEVAPSVGTSLISYITTGPQVSPSRSQDKRCIQLYSLWRVFH